MKQTKIESLVETLLNTSIGFVVSFTAWPAVAHLAGLPYSTATNLGITCAFTVLSITRSYIVRRFFNAGLHRSAKRIAALIQTHANKERGNEGPEE